MNSSFRFNYVKPLFHWDELLNNQFKKKEFKKEPASLKNVAGPQSNQTILIPCKRSEINSVQKLLSKIRAKGGNCLIPLRSRLI
jgi:hypothetical protein